MSLPAEAHLPAKQPKGADCERNGLRVLRARIVGWSERVEASWVGFVECLGALLRVVVILARPAADAALLPRHARRSANGCPCRNRARPSRKTASGWRHGGWNDACRHIKIACFRCAAEQREGHPMISGRGHRTTTFTVLSDPLPTPGPCPGRPQVAQRTMRRKAAAAERSAEPTSYAAAG